MCFTYCNVRGLRLPDDEESEPESAELSRVKPELATSLLPLDPVVVVVDAESLGTASLTDFRLFFAEVTGVSFSAFRFFALSFALAALLILGVFRIPRLFFLSFCFATEI